MRKFFLSALLVCLAVGPAVSKEKDGPEYPADIVSTTVGTLSDYIFSSGNLYPATTMPWGMNCWTPMTSGNSWTYTYDAHRIIGFKQTHQPSPWIGDYGYYVVMPLKDYENSTEDKRGSWFSHKCETALPYYYQVYLADHDVNVEIAPTERGAVLRFRFPESGKSGIVIDGAWEDVAFEVDDTRTTVTGYTTNNHGGVSDNFKNWFVLVFDKPFEDWEQVGDELTVKFGTSKGESVEVHTASSFISLDQAFTNLKETEGSFDDVKERARARWNEVLGRIELSGGTDDQYKMFYTCLYRSTLFPRKFYEVAEDGTTWHYSPYNGEVRQGTMYTDSGFWDVFRAQMPLLNLLYPSVSREIQEGLMHIAEENEFLPEWASPGHRSCMVGNNSISVAADVYLKGISADGIDKLYEAMVHGTENVHPLFPSVGRWGHEYYNTLGYVPYDVGIKENVARTLEYAYDDWCLSLVAEKMGRPASEVELYRKRSTNWRNVFDPSVNLMRGRNEDGSFQKPFSTYKWGGAFTEGNAWHYTWSVFHDVDGLAEAMGGKAVMEKMLDSVFVVPPIYDDNYYGRRIHEITEMQVAGMGNYAHGNQPSQHMIYLYDYVGRPDKCRHYVRQVLDRLYRPIPDGYCGDEDNGQTSAWYVFSALGFYPVCPVSGEYAMSSPVFGKAVVHLENGKDVTIVSKTDSEDGIIKIDGKKAGRTFVTYDKLLSGAKIKYVEGR